MKMQMPESFNERVFNCPLTPGMNLVEASAGTGKTYQLQTLYLRLIVEQDLAVSSILVVTFTEAATQELRLRLRSILSDALRLVDLGSAAFAEQVEDRERIDKVLQAAVDRGQARRRLRRAVRDFDQAAIFTIHGFCQRTLAESAFECGVAFEQELQPDCSDLVSRVVADWFRRQVYAQPRIYAAVLTANGCTPETLVEVVNKYAGKPGMELLPRLNPAAAGRLIQMLETWNRDWAENGAQIRDLAGNFTSTYRRVLEATAKAMGARAGADDFLPLFTLNKAKNWDSGKALLKKKRDDPDTVALAKKINDLQEAQTQYITQFQLQAVLAFEALFDQLKQERGIWSFDDLLLQLYSVLNEADSVGANLLQNRMRARYQAALIDEFQDTDPVQYKIFTRLFGDSVPVFLVGDPKQAIYSFRSGDIHTYFYAKTQVAGERRFSLGVNYRAETQLIDAVNEIFYEEPAGDVSADSATDTATGVERRRFSRSFLTPMEQIQYTPLAAKGKTLEDSLQIRGKPSPTPMRIQVFDGGGSKEMATQIITEWTANEIQRLLLSADYTLPSGGGARRPLHPGDMAVLTITNAQAFAMRAALVKRGIPAILLKTGDLFDTDEARDVLRLLRAMAVPSDLAAVRAALISPLLPLTVQEAEAFPETDTQALLPAFIQAGETWRKGFFIQAFDQLCVTAGIAPYLLSGENGERRVTNLMHLAEVLHQQSRRYRLGPEALISWLTAQLDVTSREPGTEYGLYLESDALAVHILTVHKSKGLQFPVVFLPYQSMMKSVGRKTNQQIYHRDRASGEPQLVLNLQADDDATAQAEYEDFSEMLRLHYVALTRGIHRTVLVLWNKEKGKNPTALHYLLSRQLPDRTEGTRPNARALLDGLPVPNGEFLQQRLVDVPEKQGRASGIEISEQSIDAQISEASGATVSASAASAPAVTLTARPFTGRIARNWELLSFSSLVQDQPAPRFDPEPIVADGDEPDLEAGEMPNAQPSDDGVFAFPAGSKTGNCWHDILEHIDFTADDESLRDEINRRLTQYHLRLRPEIQIPPERTPEDEAVERLLPMIRTLLETEMMVGNGEKRARFALQQIDRRNRLSELPFYFSLPDDGLALSRLLDALRGAGGVYAATAAALQQRADRAPDARRRLQERINGFMTGIIDLVCRLPAPDARYVIFDWKSNILNGTPAGFTPERIYREMIEHGYVLQYLLYTVALHCFLQRRLSTYEYEQDFAGICYVFLRNTAAEDQQNRVFTDCPPKSLIESLSQILTGQSRSGVRGHE